MVAHSTKQSLWKPSDDVGRARGPTPGLTRCLLPCNRQSRVPRWPSRTRQKQKQTCVLRGSPREHGLAIAPLASPKRVFLGWTVGARCPLAWTPFFLSETPWAADLHAGRGSGFLPLIAPHPWICSLPSHSASGCDLKIPQFELVSVGKHCCFPDVHFQIWVAPDRP